MKIQKSNNNNKNNCSSQNDQWSRSQNPLNEVEKGYLVNVYASHAHLQTHMHTHTYRYTHVCLFMKLSLQSFQMLLPIRLLLLLKPLAQAQHQSFVRPAEPRCDTFVASTTRVCVCVYNLCVHLLYCHLGLVHCMASPFRFHEKKQKRVERMCDYLSW